MKNCLFICVVFFQLFVPWAVLSSHAEEPENPLEHPYIEEEHKFTRFPAGTIIPMLGLSFLAINNNVLTGVTGGAGYYIIDRLELFGTISAYFGKETVLTVDPGIQWVFWESKYFAPYIKLRGGPLFTLTGNAGVGGTLLGGGGFYIFAGNVFGIKLGGLAGYLFDAGYGNGLAWEIDVGLIF